MELEWKTCTVGLLHRAPESAADSPFDLELQMPEYMPDIHRILHCSVTPQIQSVTATAERVSVEGVGAVRVLYCSEDGKIHVYSQSFPIRRAVPRSVPDGAVCVYAETAYVNCRASGQRKVSLNGAVSLRFATSDKQTLIIPTDADASDLQTQTKPLSALSVTACTEKQFAMSEVVELTDTPPVGGILSERTYVCLDSTRAVQDKLLIKGEAVTQLQYVSADDGQTLASFRHSMPISQVIEAVGVTETDLQDVSLHVLSAVITPKSDGAGDNRLLEVLLQISASVVCFAQTETQIVCDAYSTDAELCAKYSDPELYMEGLRWQDTFRIREKADTAGTDLQTLSMVSPGTVQVDCVARDGQLTAQCSAMVTMLGENSDGVSVWTEKPIAFSCSRPLPDGDGAVVCRPTVTLTSCIASMSADGVVEIQADAWIDGMVYRTNNVRMLTSAETEPLPADEEPAALTVYFADAGERVWDIARRYRTTVEAVRTENDLAEETVPQKTMLVIPLR